MTIAAAAVLAVAAITPANAFAGYPGENGRIAISAEWGCDDSFIHTVRPSGPVSSR